MSLWSALLKKQLAKRLAKKERAFPGCTAEAGNLEDKDSEELAAMIAEYDNANSPVSSGGSSDPPTEGEGETGGDAADAAGEEAGNSPFCLSQEKFHTAVLRGVGNVSETL